MKMVSQQYRAWSECMEVQAVLALYWWQRLITFSVGRIRVKNQVSMLFCAVWLLLYICTKQKTVVNLRAARSCSLFKYKGGRTNLCNSFHLQCHQKVFILHRLIKSTRSIRKSTRKKQTMKQIIAQTLVHLKARWN